jgi:hypothetical protein
MSDLADVDICQITSPIVASVISLLESHPLRAMDALHVTCALAVEPEIFLRPTIGNFRQHKSPDSRSSMFREQP